MLAALLAWLALLWAPAPRAAEPPTVVTIARAVFEPAGGGEVALPHTWRGTRPDARSWARYRAAFVLGEVPQVPYAAMFTRLSVRHAVRLNGHLVAGQPGASEGVASTHPLPALVVLPPALLRAGANELAIEVQHAGRGGLSGIDIGPAARLDEAFRTHLLWHVDLPQALNMAAGGLAVFMLLVWWRRRSEVAIGSFGLLSLLGSLRNHAYYLHGTASPAVSSLAFYLAQVATVALLCVFATALANVHWPRYRRMLLAMVVLLSLAGAVAVPLGAGQALRMVTYPLLFLATLPALWLGLRAARAARRGVVAAQAAGVLVLIASGVHDYGVIAGRLAVTEPFWLPFVMPLALGAVSLALVRRLVGAMGAVEALNAELERRVAERTHALEAASAAKTRFLAAASHDLRQPVVTIGLLVGLAREGVDLPRIGGMLGRIDAAVQAMDALLTGLLDLSRLEAGVVRPEVRALDVGALFAAVSVHEQAPAEQKGLRLRLRPGGAVVRSDPLILERILRNLVGNAVRYTDRGSVLVAARRRGEVVRIEVRDSGPGIPAEHQQAIFEEFAQLAPAHGTSVRGLGLGLAIAQRSAAMLGHRLGLRSQPGCGSCFWIEVPAEAPAALPGLPPADDVAVPAAAAPLVGRRIVLIENEDALRHALAERLAGWGAHVEAFAGMELLQRWLTEAQPRGAAPPDAVVSDYRLPQGDGLLAIAAVQERFGPVRAMVITGDTARSELERLDRAGVPVLHKPFRAEALLAMLA
ncbi:MAG TPA: hybrid sensor histidine kinase/response regulator [Albitalea sp.]